MKILIQGSKLDLTESLKVYVEEKMRGLEKFLRRWDAKDSIVLRVEVARTSKHHKKGEVYYAEVNLNMPRHVMRAESYHSDARTAISYVKKILEGEIKKYKGKEEVRRR